METKLTKEEHKERHVELYKMFDELLADYIDHSHIPLSEMKVIELMEWSHIQTVNPEE